MVVVQSMWRTESMSDADGLGMFIKPLSVDAWEGSLIGLRSRGNGKNGK